MPTDNSYLADKVALRLAHLPEADPLRVLDCYGGYGRIWQAIRLLTPHQIEVLPMDLDLRGFGLPGDNRAYLSSLSLDRFDVIDLDAYGVPYDQLVSVFGSEFVGVIFVTFIQSMAGRLPDGLLLDVGFTKAMIVKVPTLLCRRGWEVFRGWLGQNGVRRIWHRSKGRKHYLAFDKC